MHEGKGRDCPASVTACCEEDKVLYSEKCLLSWLTSCVS